jgi:hypothetical protein
MARIDLVPKGRDEDGLPDGMGTPPRPVRRRSAALKVDRLTHERDAIAAERRQLTEIMKGSGTNTPLPISIALMLVLALQAVAQEVTAKYPSMSPLEKYLMGGTAEVSLMPESISGSAEIPVLIRQAYEHRLKAKMVSPDPISTGRASKEQFSMILETSIVPSVVSRDSFGD